MTALALLCASSPALAEYFTYKGQLQLPPASDPVCTAMAGDSFDITVYGRDDGPQAIEGYLSGDKIVGGHFSGNSLNQLSLTFPGDTKPTQLMALRMAGPGAFAGEVAIKSMVAALAHCQVVKAQIRFTKVGTHTQADFDQAARLFQSDSAAVQAFVQGNQGKVKESIPVLQDALTFKSKIYGATHPQLLPNYLFLGLTRYAEGTYAEALKLYSQALAVCDQSYGTDSPCSFLVLSYLGGARLDNGDNAGAEADLRRALALSDKLFGASAPVSGVVLTSLGAVLINNGHYGEAETTLNQALVLNRKRAGGDNAIVGLTLHNLAVVYRVTGQYKKAQDVMRQALAVDEKTLGHDAPLTILNRAVLANFLRLAGDYAGAEQLARQALADAERVLGPERPDHPTLGFALMALGDTLRETGRNSEAQPVYRQALANTTKFLGADHYITAFISVQLAKSLRATGGDAEALTLLQHSYRIARATDNQLIGWRVPAELMQFYAASHPAQRGVAIFYGKEALNYLQKLRGNLSGSTAETQQAFVSAAEISSVYRTLADLLIAEGRLSEAQQVLAMVKEQELYDYTEHQSDADAPKTVATLDTSEQQLDELGGKEVTLGKEFGALQEKYHKEKDHFSAADHARLDQLRKAMDAAQAAFDAHVAAIASTSNDPEAREQRQHELNNFSRAFQGTLKKMGHDAVLAQYMISDDKVAIFLTTPNVVLEREMPIKREDLNELIRGFRTTLSNPSMDPVPQATALYKLLIAPIADDLRQAGAKTLMLSLDDTLRYLPFAALYDGHSYLVENLAVVIVTEAVRDKLGAPPGEKSWSVWGLGVTKGGSGYDPLPYAGVELNGIAGKKGILGGTVLLDSAFNEGSLRDGLDQGYPIIHIASHFQFAPGDMDDSFLLLGDGSHLTLAQIKTKLNFTNVELLTLSACQTALGDDGVAHHGVEVESLGAIAQQAGAHAVLATLWPVADVSTAGLMRALYEAHKDDHLDKAEALRKAQLALLHGTVKAEGSSQAARGLSRIGTSQAIGNFKVDPKAPYAHPFFWAPFILMGNWQ
ncbi:MAG TPA: tetratricopeptide repeat protein [Steroidobacteraceae bacterium]